MKAVDGWDAFQGEASGFAGGWFRDLRVYALDYSGRIKASAPLRLDSEDLSGGQSKREKREYRGARKEDDAIVIDLYADGRLEKTVSIIDLNG